jgi:hypothetical protein
LCTSANPLSSDPNYSDLVGKIRELDVLALESTIDFSQEEYHNSLWIWDDCDSGFTVSLEDLDSRLTEEELQNLSVTDRVKATSMLKAKCEAASEWCEKSIQSFMMNGRKFGKVCALLGTNRSRALRKQGRWGGHRDRSLPSFDEEKPPC